MRKYLVGGCYSLALLMAIASFTTSTSTKPSTESLTNTVQSIQQLASDPRQTQVQIDIGETQKSPVALLFGMLSGAFAIGGSLALQMKEEIQSAPSPLPLLAFADGFVANTLVAGDRKLNPSQPLASQQLPPNPSPASKAQTINQQPPVGDRDWLDIFINSHCHLAINGITGSGKTTLAEYALQLWDCEVLLIDPKYNALEPAWSVPPLCSNINEVMGALKHVESRMLARQQNREAHYPIAIVVDEFDWLCLTYKAKAINVIRALYKVGRSLGFRLIICGQSPYANNFDGSDWRNFNRIILNGEALSFCENRQFPYEKNAYHPLCQQYQASGVRYGMFIPTGGVPFINPIPDIGAKVQPSDSEPEPEDLDTLESQIIHLNKSLEQPLAKETNADGVSKAITVLPTYLQTIVDFANKRRDWISARDVKQQKFKTFQKSTTADIRDCFSELIEDYQLGEVQGEGDRLQYRCV